MTITYRSSHMGLCVTDLDRSLRFWCDGLGFELDERFDLTDTLAPGLAEALEVQAPVDLVSQMIVMGEWKFELLYYATPKPQGAPSATRGQLGFSHMSFWVDDVDAAAQRLVEYGGTILPTTRSNPGIPIQFVADPDGVRVELMGQ
jgi:catechol 2,3-dioxygenase-like lactoylglutathione lyase family enzyme